MASETIKRIVGFVDFFSDDTRNGYKIPQSEYAANGRNLIIDQGDNEIAGYSDRDEGLYTSVPAVVFGDHTRIIKYVDKPFFIGADGVKILKPQRGVDPKYAYYALKAARIESLGYSRHFKVVKELHFVLPDDVAQRRIAAALDKISEMKRNAEARLQKLDLLVKSRFNEMFGDVCKNTLEYPTEPMNEVAAVGSSKRIFQNEYVDTGIPFYRTKEIVELAHGKPISTSLFITKSRYQEIKERFGVPQKGDLLVSAVGTIGEIWIVDGEREFYFKDGNLMQIRPSNKMDSVFLRYCLEAFIKDFKRTMPQGTAYAALTIEMVKKFQTIVPPLAVQRSFAAFVEKVEALRATAQASLARVDLLYRAKLQEYFG